MTIKLNDSEKNIENDAKDFYEKLKSVIGISKENERLKKWVEFYKDELKYQMEHYKENEDIYSRELGCEAKSCEIYERILDLKAIVKKLSCEKNAEQN